jgi:hypothetical protein
LETVLKRSSDRPPVDFMQDSEARGAHNRGGDDMRLFRSRLVRVLALTFILLLSLPASVAYADDISAASDGLSLPEDPGFPLTFDR